MSPLAKRRILVVEDEFLISAMLCDMLSDVAAVVIGPAANVSSALLLLRQNHVDAAILDMNLSGEWSDPIALELNNRQIPFVFTSGYGANALSERFGARTVEKPYTWDDVEVELASAIAEYSANSHS